MILSLIALGAMIIPAGGCSSYLLFPNQALASLSVASQTQCGHPSLSAHTPSTTSTNNSTSLLLRPRSVLCDSAIYLQKNRIGYVRAGRRMMLPQQAQSYRES